MQPNCDEYEDGALTECVGMSLGPAARFFFDE